MPFISPIDEVIRQRHSCRTYTKTPISSEQVTRLADFAEMLKVGIFGTSLRFALAVATEQDQKSLKGLGTYGLIKNPVGFIIGAAGPGVKNLEDFGYAMESIILYATRLGLGSCWLGGNFTKSSFSRKIETTEEEIVPAVAAIGYAAKDGLYRDWLRRQAKSHTRRPWEELFFYNNLRNPLSEQSEGAYAKPLEMVRLAPSAHNYQPWRVVRDGPLFHFFLQRTRGYGPGSATFILFSMADLQRIEMGISMCHFQLTADELGLKGRWEMKEPAILGPGDMVEYVSTWVCE